MECGGRWLLSGADERQDGGVRTIICNGSALYSGKCQSALMEVSAVRPERSRSGNTVITRLLYTIKYMETGFYDIGNNISDMIKNLWPDLSVWGTS